MEGLATESFEQKLLYGNCENDEQDYLKIHNLSFSFAKNIPTLKRSINLISDVKALLAIRREMLLYRPHIVHTHMSKAGILGRVSAIMTLPTAKIVHTYHGLIFDGYFGVIKTKVFIFLEKVLGNKTHRIVAVGSKTRMTIIQEGITNSEKVHVINPGLISPKPSNFLTGVKTNNELIRGLWIGRLTHIKRPDRLLQILRIIKRDSLNFTFRVAGTGPEESAIREISERENLPVTFLGNVKDIDFEIENSDFVLCTSDSEGVPLALIQAQLHGKPVISTRVGSVSDLVIHGETGYLGNRNPEDLVNLMRIFTLNRELLHMLGYKAKSHAQQHFSLLRFIHDYQILYINLM
jgi:glycosyltransferase involved in cell wall biosynthesis